MPDSILPLSVFSPTEVTDFSAQYCPLAQSVLTPDGTTQFFSDPVITQYQVALVLGSANWEKIKHAYFDNTPLTPKKTGEGDAATASIGISMIHHESSLGDYNEVVFAVEVDPPAGTTGPVYSPIDDVIVSTRFAEIVGEQFYNIPKKFVSETILDIDDNNNISFHSNLPTGENIISMTYSGNAFPLFGALPAQQTFVHTDISDNTVLHPVAYDSLYRGIRMGWFRTEEEFYMTPNATLDIGGKIGENLTNAEFDPFAIIFTAYDGAMLSAFGNDLGRCG